MSSNGIEDAMRAGGGTRTARPHSLTETREAVIAPGVGKVVMRGAGTAHGWAGPAEPADLVLDTTSLSGIISYNPSDMTISVKGGTPLLEVQRVLAEHGQWVAFDAARVSQGATVGGLLATADAGPRRHRYGSLRDLVLGATLVLADGTVARSGGHVIKNVAGYDLAKLMSGSFGTLAVIAELVLRTHPLPEETATVTVDAHKWEATKLSRAILASGAEPSSLEWWTGRLHLHVEGTQRGVRARAEKVVDLVGGERLEGAEAQRTWRELGTITCGQSADTVLRFGTEPRRMPEVVHRLDTLVAAHDVESAEIASGTSTGAHTIRLRGGSAAGHAAALEEWRHELAEIGAYPTLRRRIPGMDARTPSWGPPPRSIGSWRSIKAVLDPNGRLGAGRFHPWF